MIKEVILPLPISFKSFRESLGKRKRHVPLPEISREEIIIRKLEKKLGKNDTEVRNMISKDLMALLLQVPTSNSL